MFSVGKTETKSEDKKDPPKFSFGSGSSVKSKDAAPKFSFGSKSDNKKDEKDEPAKPAGGFFANLGGEFIYSWILMRCNHRSKVVFAI